jgi:hypothetical protein
MDRMLKWFIRGWMALAVGINIVAIIGFFVDAKSFWAGWQRVADTYGPFNLWNWLMELLLVSPALGAMVWLGRRQKRADQASQPST